jgi:hypothetical protein
MGESRDQVTAAGHASMATGVPPVLHGIIANDWYDRNEGKVNAVRTERYQPVPMRRLPSTCASSLTS